MLGILSLSCCIWENKSDDRNDRHCISILQTPASTYWQDQHLRYGSQHQQLHLSPNNYKPRLDLDNIANAPSLISDNSTIVKSTHLDRLRNNEVLSSSNSLFSFLLVCRLCSYSTSEISDYHNHMVYQHDHDSKTMICPYCDYVAPKMDNFRVHLRKHTGEKPFSCSFCSYRCAHSSNMKVHMRRCAEKSSTNVASGSFDFH